MNETHGWFGRRGIASLAQAQQKSAGGISAVTRTCIAAYRQWDDLEWLLKNMSITQIDEVQHDEAKDYQLTKIKERHEKYRAQQEAEVIPERA